MEDVMVILKEFLDRIGCGPLLDIASGSGRFGFLMAEAAGEGFPPVLTDTSPGGLSRVPPERASRALMKGEALAFPEGSFAAVSMANSLHHMESPGAVLEEMKRVLRPGGLLVVYEMFADGDQTEAQRTHTLLHNWWSDVDRYRGVCHNRVANRSEIELMLDETGLERLSFTVHRDLSGDPYDPQMMKHLEKARTHYMEQAKGEADLIRSGEAAWKHCREFGFAGASSILAVGYKPVSPAS